MMVEWGTMVAVELLLSLWDILVVCRLSVNVTLEISHSGSSVTGRKFLSLSSVQSPSLSTRQKQAETSTRYRRDVCGPVMTSLIPLLRVLSSDYG